MDVLQNYDDKNFPKILLLASVSNTRYWDTMLCIVTIVEAIASEFRSKISICRLIRSKSNGVAGSLAFLFVFNSNMLRLPPTRLQASEPQDLKDVEEARRALWEQLAGMEARLAVSNTRAAEAAAAASAAAAARAKADTKAARLGLHK